MDILQCFIFMENFELAVNRQEENKRTLCVYFLLSLEREKTLSKITFKTVVSIYPFCIHA